MSYEKKVFEYFENKIIISETDRDLIPHIDKNKIQVVPNGVDFEYFNHSAVYEKQKKYDIVFTGNMGYPPNVNCAMYIAETILPLMIHEFPNIRIVFAGANPHSSLQKLRNKHIEVTGWVDDIREYYANSKVFLAPMQIGTGLQNKLLEAMAMKLPCVTSSLANNALGAEHGKEIIVADEAHEVAKALSYLLNNIDESNRIANNGFEYVKKRFSWVAWGEKLNNIIVS
jgi:polysaccharide biosynthesis protein PslH